MKVSIDNSQGLRGATFIEAIANVLAQVRWTMVCDGITNLTQEQTRTKFMRLVDSLERDRFDSYVAGEETLENVVPGGEPV